MNLPSKKVRATIRFALEDAKTRINLSTFTNTESEREREMEEVLAALIWLYELPQTDEQPDALAPHAVAIPEPNWQDAPEWAMWWAVDADGLAHWCEEEPILVVTVNYCGWYPKCIGGIQQGEMAWIDVIEIPLGCDWRLLKAQRHTVPQAGTPPTLAE